VPEPDTPDKPYSNHMDRLVLPSSGGARSRSASLGERWSGTGGPKGKEREEGFELDGGRRSVGGWVESLPGHIGEEDDLLDSDDEGTIGSDDSSDAGSDSSLKIKVQSQIHLPLLPLPGFPPSLSRKPTLSFTAAPPTPPATDGSASTSSHGYFFNPSLPTPALSSASLSSSFNFFTSSTAAQAAADSDGITTMTTSAKRVTRKEILSLARNMIPTLLGIGLAFVLSLGLMVGLLGALPIPPSLRGGLPKSGADIKLLSGAIMAYMDASPAGYMHTLTALGAVGVWTHAWSVPGSVVLNILMGALFPAVPAVAFLTLSTTVGGYCSYLLSRPLSPLITLLFPTQLAVVRASLASSGAGAGGGAWKKLLVMRATGLVPWSGMNVACGVVGVRWTVFCATFAAGGLSWNASHQPPWQRIHTSASGTDMFLSCVFAVRHHAARRTHHPVHVGLVRLGPVTLVLPALALTHHQTPFALAPFTPADSAQTQDGCHHPGGPPLAGRDGPGRRLDRCRLATYMGPMDVARARGRTGQAAARPGCRRGWQAPSRRMEPGGQGRPDRDRGPPTAREWLRRRLRVIAGRPLIPSTDWADRFSPARNRLPTAVGSASAVHPRHSGPKSMRLPAPTRAWAAVTSTRSSQRPGKGRRLRFSCGLAYLRRPRHRRHQASFSAGTRRPSSAFREEEQAILATISSLASRSLTSSPPVDYRTVRPPLHLMAFHPSRRIC